jgi:hypothetical protein
MRKCAGTYSNSRFFSRVPNLRRLRSKLSHSIHPSGGAEREEKGKGLSAVWVSKLRTLGSIMVMVIAYCVSCGWCEEIPHPADNIMMTKKKILKGVCK